MIIRVFLHTYQAARELAQARCLTMQDFLSQAVTTATINELTELDLQPEPSERLYATGRARFDEPMLAASFNISPRTKQSLRAASKRHRVSIAQICRALADRFIGGCDARAE
jgi:hypothetical protein